MWGALSDEGRVCRLQLLLALASAVILGSESRGTFDHILLSQIRDFFFIVSYDSQGHGGGIRPRLHTGGILDLHSHWLLYQPENLVEITASKVFMLLFENALCQKQCVHS
jgi:hypothetical protein